MTKVYVDADVPLFVCSSYAADDFPGIPDLGIADGTALDVRFAAGLVDEWVDRWVDPLNPTEVHYCYSYGSNYRKDLTATYKAKRGPKPEAFLELQAHLMARPEAMWIEGLEADDVIGIRCTEDPEAIAVSIDKDFFTVPMIFYRPGFLEMPTHISEDEANHFWMIQTLTGDSVDGITGIPKVGPVKAKKMLPVKEPLESLWRKVKAAYAEKGLSNEEALLNARLTRILRAGDYDFDNGSVLLWEGC